ncbi:MAG TPA: Gfo/Idh/MocA family oxidoreductase [Tepidisphaeraceae bacterium]|nr:Gfo/Idh/MocA family oxidoreductase [Tepidisphaeraceae bacterium]
MQTLNIGIIGAGAIALANHVPGFALCDDVRVTALCDSNAQTLAQAAQKYGVSKTFERWEDLLAQEDVHAVVVATPNFLHAPITIAAARAGKHVLCEKPIAMNVAEAVAMARACDVAGVRHMTAFTYRFVPAMRYMTHLVRRGDIGQPYHFRAQRFQDWGDRNLGWRQVKKLAGSGELGDMLTHRIDYGHLLVGPIERLVSDQQRFLDTRAGNTPSDLDDWVAIMARFTTGATGMLESTKLATGRGEGHYGLDLAEVNGPGGTLAFTTQKPLELKIGRPGAKDLETVMVPAEFLVYPGSNRDPKQGDPVATFRYDQNVEFINAIRDGRDCSPNLWDGAAVQAVMDAAIQSADERRWVDVPRVARSIASP